MDFFKDLLQKHFNFQFKKKKNISEQYIKQCTVLGIPIDNSYFYIKCAKRVFFVHEKVFYAETKVEAV
jgi:hypothetical protein